MFSGWGGGTEGEINLLGWEVGYLLDYLWDNKQLFLINKKIVDKSSKSITLTSNIWSIWLQNAYLP